MVENQNEGVQSDNQKYVFVFDEKGHFKERVPTDADESYGVLKQANGKNIKFDFVDPEHYPGQIMSEDELIANGHMQGGGIKSHIHGQHETTSAVLDVVVVSQDDIAKMLKTSDVYQYEGQGGWVGAARAAMGDDNEVYEYFREESRAGKLDYVFGPELSRNTLYLVESPDGSGYVAHDEYNFGNLLWGASTEVAGIPNWVAKKAADKDVSKNERDEGDTPDDQKSIEQGIELAKQHSDEWKESIENNKLPEKFSWDTGRARDTYEANYVERLYCYKDAFEQAGLDEESSDVLAKYYADTRNLSGEELENLSSRVDLFKSDLGQEIIEEMRNDFYTDCNFDGYIMWDMDLFDVVESMDQQGVRSLEEQGVTRSAYLLSKVETEKVDSENSSGVQSNLTSEVVAQPKINP